jgi:rhomboid family GlyGly-CTERM serine protease
MGAGSGPGWQGGAAGTQPGRHWAALSLVLCAASALAWWLPAPLLDWQPGLAWQEPWRAWTSAWVHWSPMHLGANLGAALVVGAFGWAAQVPPPATLAWLLAWPLTHWSLLLQPELAHYGGLSGMLHGGVAIVCAWLLATAAGVRRAIGAAVGLGLVLKLWSEEPWGTPLRHSAEWDIAVAPLAHTTGALAGLACAGALWSLLTLRRRRAGAASATARSAPRP